MPTGRPKRVEIVLTPAARVQLEELGHARSLPQGVVRGAQILLASAAGNSNTAITRRLSLGMPTIGLWRDRHLTHGQASRGMPRAGVCGSSPRRRAFPKAPCSAI